MREWSTINLLTMGTMKPRQMTCLAMVGLTMLLAGCAHSPSSSLPEAIQPPLGKIGVVVKLAEEGKTLEIPRTGRWSNLWRGAAQWGGPAAAVGAELGIGCNILLVVCSPGLALAFGIPGLIAGGVYGVINSESFSGEDERAFETALTNSAFEDIILSQTITWLRERGYEVDKLSAGAPRTAPEQASDPASPPDSVDAILEISNPVVQLAPVRVEVNPLRHVIMFAQIRVIGTADKTVLADRSVTEEAGPARSLAEWGANDANTFRVEVSLKAHRLGISISELILEKFPERRVSMNTN